MKVALRMAGFCFPCTLTVLTRQREPRKFLSAQVRKTFPRLAKPPETSRAPLGLLDIGPLSNFNIRRRRLPGISLSEKLLIAYRMAKAGKEENMSVWTILF